MAKNFRGGVFVNRKIINWQWFNDSKIVHVWLYILVMTNWKNGEFEGVQIPRGTCVTSVRNISRDTGISDSTVRRILKKLEKTGEISVKATHRFTLINVVKFNEYQFLLEQGDNNLTISRQNDDKKMTKKWQQNEQQYNKVINKESNKGNKEKGEKKAGASFSAPSLGADGFPWFEKFWELYPNQYRKDITLKLWREQGCEAIGEKILKNVKERNRYSDCDYRSTDYIENKLYLRKPDIRKAIR